MIAALGRTIGSAFGTLIEATHGIVAKGGEKLLDIIGAGMTRELNRIVDKAAAELHMPAADAQRIKDLWSGHGEWQALLGSAAGGTAVGGIISSTFGPWLKHLEYAGLRTAVTARLTPAEAVTAIYRNRALAPEVSADLRDQGYTTERIAILRMIHHTLLDAASLTRYRFRFEMTEADYLIAMEKLGFQGEEAKRFYEVSHFYPAPADLIRWQAREVFEPAMVTKYGLDDEYDVIEKEPFYKAGMTDEQIKNFWRAHWEHPGFDTVVEMLRRTEFSETDMKDWFRLVEIPPFWRQKLIDISYAVPTRVDVRRWWDLRTIDEARLREIYGWQGYKGKDLEDYVLWTKVYTAWPDLVARWKNGWITEEQVRSELTAMGVPAARIQELIETKIKTSEPARTSEERDLTKAEIYAGVKKDVISWPEGIEMLMDLGYSADEAQFILEVRVGVAEGSPETYQEFKRWTQGWRKAQGLPAKVPDARIIEAERKVKSLELQIKNMRVQLRPQAEIAPIIGELGEAEYRYHALLVSLQQQPG